MIENEKIIKLENIKKKYGNKLVLNDINLQITKGKIHALIGPNGSGKTTLIKILNGFVFPNSGKIEVNKEKDIKNGMYFRKEIAYFPTEENFSNLFKVNDYVKFICLLRHIKMKKWYDLINIDLFSTLKQSLEDNCNLLSTGWKKILQIASNSLFDPSILIMDEITNGLDPSFRSMVLRSILEAKKKGKTIIISSHILSDIQEIADEITIIKKGNIAFSGKKPNNIQEEYEKIFGIKEIKTFF